MALRIYCLSENKIEFVLVYLSHISFLVSPKGCGNGKYLDINPDVMKIGSDHCASLTAAARSRGHEVTTCDNLRLPFRDESFDAVLSVAVIHHFATTERRVAAIQELTRVLRIGGRLLITVWAVEQRHRKVRLLLLSIL